MPITVLSRATEMATAALSTWRPLFFIIAANLSFGVLLGGLPLIGIPAMGLIAAIFALTIISSMAAGHFHVAR